MFTINFNYYLIFPISVLRESLYFLTFTSINMSKHRIFGLLLNKIEIIALNSHHRHGMITSETPGYLELVASLRNSECS
jgi:hypothetical protein